MATVIKRESVPGGHLRSFHMGDIEAEAGRIVAAAQKQAAAILAEVRSEAARIRDEARTAACEEGHAQGIEQGRSEGREQAFQDASAEFARQQADLVEACRQAIRHLAEQKARLLLEARTDVVRLAIAIAHRVVKRVAAVRDLAAEVAVENAAEALEIVGRQTDVALHVNPADLDAITTFAASLVESSRECRHVHLIADETVSSGGCVLTTAEGRVDASLDKQLDRIAELLVGKAAE